MQDKQKGFTLPELLIVLAISSVLFVSIGTLAISSFPKSSLSIESSVVRQYVRRAQSKSIDGTQDKTWGVYLTSTQMILFAGATYATRIPSLSQTHKFPSGISASSISEIDFSARAGTPNIVGNIILNQSSTGASVTLTINEAGKIE